MRGQYTLAELRAMGHITSSADQLFDGIIIRVVGKTVNYYCLCSDGLWNNYDCKTRD